jgi:uncharacterized protein YoxC
MELQLPLALQVALYAASFAVVVSALVLVGAMLQSRKRLVRVADALEELTNEMKPLAQEARVVVNRLNDLSGRAQEQWTAVEGIVATARRWSDRTTHFVEEVGAAVGTPILATTHGFQRLRGGILAILQGLWNRNAPRQEEESGGNGRAGVAEIEFTKSQESEEVMSENNQGGGNGIVVAALVGAAVGAGIALLLAPCSGRETRGWLASRSREIKDKASRAFEQGMQATERAVTEIENAAEGVLNSADRPARAETGSTTLRS